MGPAPKKNRRKLTAIIAAVAICAVGGITVWLAIRPAPEPAYTGNEVPLGVEQAVIIRYPGPRLIAQPYRRGASVNLRIADQVQLDGVRVYDVRYVVNLPGEFDVTDYLATADGTPLDDLPSFVVSGQTRLTKDIESRIREIEDVGVHIWHGYYETLVGLGVIWILWLLGLIFVGRPPRPAKPAPAVPPRTLAEQIAPYVERLASGDLTTEDKARLEILLLRFWRQRLEQQDHRLAADCRQLRGSEPWGRAYRTLEAWLHDPTARISRTELLDACATKDGGHA
jgi:hypothetical protein